MLEELFQVEEQQSGGFKGWEMAAFISLTTVSGNEQNPALGFTSVLRAFTDDSTSVFTGLG